MLLNLPPAIKKIKKLDTSGDTIIEVLLSVTILGLVLALSFTSTGRSLNAGTDAANRNQALAYGQEQVELLRSAANAGTLSSFPTDGTTFCVNPSDGTKTAPSSDGYCHLTGEDPFGVAVKYTSANQTFNITTQWDGASGSNQVVLYYQAPVNPITTAPNVGITITASPSVIPYKGSTTITWTTTTALSCTAAGAWSGSKPTAGSQAFSNLTTTGTYSMTCLSTDGQSSLTKSAKVYVSQLPAPVINLTASPQTVYYGNSSTLSWSTSNAVSCQASGGWSGNKPLSGSQSTGSLSSDTTFTLTCVNADGVSTSSKSTTVYIAAAPTISYFYAAPNPVAYGGANTYLYWSSSGATVCYSPQLGWLPSGGNTPSGSIYSSTTFSLSCYNGLWSNASQTTVEVPPPTPVMTNASYHYTGSNGQLDLSGVVNDHNISGTTAWFEEPTCNIGAFPTAQQSVPTNTANNNISATIYPWTFYYCGLHNPYYFQICAQNVAGTACSGYYPLYQ